MSELHLPNRIRHSALARPSDPAITCGDRTLTCADLDAETNALASALVGVSNGGARVGALLRMGLEGAETFIACAKAGAVFIPLNWRLSPRELVDVAEDAELDVLIVDDEFAVGAAAISAVLPEVTVATVGDEGGVTDSRTWAEFVASGTGIDPGLGHDPDTAVLQLYTSGTTGRPKGVVATHRNLYNEPVGFEVYEFGSNAVALDALPLFHIAGAGWMSTCLSAGVPMVLLGDMAPARVAEAIATQHVTHAFLVPAVIQTLVDLPTLEGFDLSSLEVVAYGASPITPALLAHAMNVLNCKFVQRYGMTETTGSVSVLRAYDHHVSGPRSGLLRSAGKPMIGVEISIRDVMTGEELPPNESGEIVARSRNNTRGYWRRERESAELFTHDGFLRTGDAGHLDDEGYLFVTDRLKDMIITGGENVYPIEVESILAEHPSVAEVAVVGVPDKRWGESVTAVIKLVDGADVPSVDELIAFSAARLASYKKPRQIHFVDSLPRNASGKLLKSSLRTTLSASGEAL
ncbi:AMP-binding protein [Rhodococcus globerulus]|uniref:AMP-binding protein n=1 Tax=Rhodococcus globerulus TaxID=33008 RepID=UPI001F1FB70D|nr:AMP-binding protein [Rhodococcus globerulus]MCE4265675.1 AMP-binding protein [Rhodococcus globerulus]